MELPDPRSASNCANRRRLIFTAPERKPGRTEIRGATADRTKSSSITLLTNWPAELKK